VAQFDREVANALRPSLCTLQGAVDAGEHGPERVHGVEDLVGGEDARWAIDLRALLGHQQVVKREDVARTQAIISVDGGGSAQP
jgi:hypothetical protein